MCQSSVYAVNGEQEELLLEQVSAVEVDGEQVRLQTLFGEPLALRAWIKEIDLMKHRIVLQRRQDSDAPPGAG